MRKMTFYPTMFHTNPFSYNMIELWDQEGSNAKELILMNHMAKELGISKMELNVVKFSVFDNCGKEFIQGDFPNRVELNAKGIDTEFFVNIKSTLKLGKGTYTSIRFYVTNTANRFIYNNGRKETLKNLDHLDFVITNDLHIEGTQDLQVTMRFDFELFSLKSYFGSLLNIFKKPRPSTGRLVNYEVN